MNDAMLEKLASEIANATIRETWPFYLLLLAMTFLGTVAGAYLRANLTKRGEVAATKADAKLIIEHLEKTTAATKAVELALNHGDWIRRESNALKRAKLEQLIVAGFALATHASDVGTNAIAGEDLASGAPIDEFEMLSQLYFPELLQLTGTVTIRYRECLIAAGSMRGEIAKMRMRQNFAIQNGQSEEASRLAEEIKSYLEQNGMPLTQKKMLVYIAAKDLCNKAYDVMTELTDFSSATS